MFAFFSKALYPALIEKSLVPDPLPLRGNYLPSLLERGRG